MKKLLIITTLALQILIIRHFWLIGLHWIGSLSISIYLVFIWIYFTKELLKKPRKYKGKYQVFEIKLEDMFDKFKDDEDEAKK